MIFFPPNKTEKIANHLDFSMQQTEEISNDLKTTPNFLLQPIQINFSNSDLLKLYTIFVFCLHFDYAAADLGTFMPNPCFAFSTLSFLSKQKT